MELLGQLAQTLQATIDEQEKYIGACERALSSLRSVSKAADGQHGAMMVVDEEHQASSTIIGNAASSQQFVSTAADEGRRTQRSAMVVVDEDHQGHRQAV